MQFVDSYKQKLKQSIIIGGNMIMVYTWTEESHTRWKKLVSKVVLLHDIAREYEYNI